LWPVFAAYLIIAYPFAYFMSAKNTYRFVFRPVTNLLFFCLKIFEKIDYEIKNLDILKEAVNDGPVIIGCNHQSIWETFVFSKLFTELSIVIKKELLDIAIARMYFKKLGCIVINRESSVSSIRTLLKSGRRSIDRNVSILIFMNGTRSSNSGDDYKVGVFALYEYLKTPVVIASVDSGKCWPRKAHVKKPGTIILEFKKIIKPGFDKNSFLNSLKHEQDF
jgi:1-acyl-sn-glycerol-3-phosphate acyltransferase